MERRSHSEESDEGLGHSGSDGESHRTGSPTHPKIENLEELEKIEQMNVDPENVVLDENGKRKEDLYKCRYCDRTFCYLCHLKVKINNHLNLLDTFNYPLNFSKLTNYYI